MVKEAPKGIYPILAVKLRSWVFGLWSLLRSLVRVDAEITNAKAQDQRPKSKVLKSIDPTRFLYIASSCD